MHRPPTIVLLAALAAGMTACALPDTDSSPPPAKPSSAPPTQIIAVVDTEAPPSATSTPLVATSIPPSQTPPASPTPYGCLRPADDITPVSAGGFTLNQRTLSMLEYAQTLYGGSHSFRFAITQGSYNTSVDASFGTHDCGGAVDLSLRDLANWHHILYQDAEAMILALRQAGFAAWVRDTDSLYPGSPVHIHAIAVGDPELSPAAQSQLSGPEGYFRGNNGLPQNIQPDPHGGPILCPWMVEMGYRDLRP